MAKTFNLSVLSSEGVIYSGKTVSLVAPSEIGYLGILADHAPLAANLGSGKISARGEDGGEKKFDSVGSGFLHVLKNEVTVFLASLLLLALPLSSESFSEEIRIDSLSYNIDLKDSIETALMNNRQIKIQEEEISYARANILYAKSNFLPTVNLGYDYKYNDTVFYSKSLPDHRKDTRIYSGYKNNNQLFLNVTETVYNGGADIATLEEARVNLKAQQETLRAGRLEVEFETKRLFYGLLLAYETRRIAENLVHQAKAHYEDVKKMFNQGTASRFDVLQSKVQVSRQIPQLVNAESAIDIIKVEFKKLLVLNMKDSVEIKGKLAFDEINIDENSFLKEAYAHRPEMILKLLGIDIEKWAIEFARAGWLPQVTATGAYTYTGDNFAKLINDRHDNWNIGIRASVAVFDGFATKAKVDEAKAKYRQAVLSKEDYIDQIAVDVRNACLDMTKAKAIVDSQKDSVEEAREALRLSEVRFDNGVGINLDVLDAQVALAQVEQNLAQGIYDYIMAKAQLDRIMGKEFYPPSQSKE